MHCNLIFTGCFLSCNIFYATKILSEMSRILQKPVPADDSNWTEMWLPKLLHQCTTDLSGDKQLCAKQLLKSYNDLQGTCMVIFCRFFVIFLVFQ